MRWLLHGLAVAGIVVTLAVSALGPQAFITTQNVARAMDPGLVPADGQTGLDLPYLLALDADSIPTLVMAVDSLDPATRHDIAQVLRDRRAALDAESSRAGWPGWNLAREQARLALEPLPSP